MLFMHLNISVEMVFIRDPKTELGDRLHSVNLDLISDKHLKLLVIRCFEFISLYIQAAWKWQTMEQYLKLNSMKALYILVLHYLQGKFDVGANKRQSIF